MKKRDFAVVTFLVLFVTCWFVTFWFCARSAFGGTDSPLCPLMEEITGYITLAAILLTVVFLISWVAGDPSAREREAKRQIMLEAPHVLMPPEEVGIEDDAQDNEDDSAQGLYDDQTS